MVGLNRWHGPNLWALNRGDGFMGRPRGVGRLVIPGLQGGVKGTDLSENVGARIRQGSELGGSIALRDETTVTLVEQVRWAINSGKRAVFMRYLYGLAIRRAVPERRQESCAPQTVSKLTAQLARLYRVL